MKRKNALLCGASPFGFVQDQLWAGLALGLVWGSTSLGSRPDSRSVSDSFRAGLARSSARLGSAQIGLNSVRFGSVLEALLGSTRSWAVLARSLARHGSRLG